MYLFILTIFRFLPGSSSFQCVLLLQREKQSQSRLFELFLRYIKDFDPGPLSVFSWSLNENEAGGDPVLMETILLFRYLISY